MFCHFDFLSINGKAVSERIDLNPNLKSAISVLLGSCSSLTRMANEDVELPRL
jgi:hypothetical protein